jgi:hypothetical protein
MARRTAIDSVNQSMVAFGQPLGEPQNASGDNPALQRALDTLNHVAYRTRSFVHSALTLPVTVNVPPSAGDPLVLYRWRMHTPDVLTNYAFLMDCRRSVGSNGTFILTRDGTTVATVTPIDSATVFSVRSDLVGGVGSVGDHTWEVRAARRTVPTGTVTFRGVWVAYANVTVP